MKRYMILLVIFLLTLFTMQVALADTTAWIEVPCPSLFNLLNARYRNGTILLTGYSGSPMDSIPQLICVDLSGNILWSMVEDDESNSHGDFYRDACYREDGTVLALRSLAKSDGSSDWVVESIENGKITKQSQPLPSTFDLHSKDEGYLSFIQPQYTTARIERFNQEGQSLWKIDWDEPIMFYGILVRKDLNIAYGSRKNQATNGDEAERDPTSVVVAFDDSGAVLWRNDSEKIEVFRDAVWTNDGRITLIGDCPSIESSNEDERWGNGFIAEYDALGNQRWRTEYKYFNNSDRESGELLSIAPYQSGYLVAARVGGNTYSTRLIQFDAKGNLLKEWDEPLGDLYTYSLTLLPSPDGVCLVANGMTTPTGEETSIARVPRLTILKQII